MKKTLSILVIFSPFIISSLYAQQRIIDQEVICTSPAGEVQNGGSLPLRFTMINHGPDSHKAGDTTLYTVYSIIEGEEIIAYTGPLINSGSLDSGASIEYTDDYGIQFNLPYLEEAMTFEFCIHLFSRALLTNGDSLIMSYDDPDMSNNTCCKEVILLPKTSVTNSNNDSSGFAEFIVYPNPADKHIVLPNITGNNNTLIRINDLSGRLLLQQKHTPSNREKEEITIPVFHLNEGLYILNIHTEIGESNLKLWIKR